MKPTPKTETFQRFTEALRHIVSVPKSEVDAAIKARQKARKAKRAASRVSDPAKG
jgi:hypothetical protein